MSKSLLENLPKQITTLHDQGLYKPERIIYGPQSAEVNTKSEKVINLCANNYLGLANAPVLIDAAQKSMATYGFGAASVRFICGTQDIHKTLEKKLSDFLGMEDTILYSSCFDANGGLFETLLDAEDAVISDALNHASIIDGVRLCKAQRLRYSNNDMTALEECLQNTQDARYRLIVTDGVFSMDGVITNLPRICELAKQYDALVMVDDSHAVGVLGEHGRGTHEYFDVMGEVDIITGTLGKALGGASGGYTSAKAPIVEWLRQRSRPYLFSNSLAPSIAAASITALDLMLSEAEADASADKSAAIDGKQLRTRLWENTTYFRTQMTDRGFTLAGEGHPIIPVMIGDAALAAEFSRELLNVGIYAMAFSFPVVPKGQARIRTQMSAALTQQQLDVAIDAFVTVAKKLNLI